MGSTGDKDGKVGTEETSETGSVDSSGVETGSDDTGGDDTGGLDTSDTSDTSDIDSGDSADSADTGTSDDLAGAAAKLIGEDAGDYASEVVGALGDVDGDGRSDMLIAAPEREWGTAYLVLGPVSGLFDLGDATGSLTMNSDDFDDGASSGWSWLNGAPITSAGDGDGDGLPDLILGTPFAGSDTEGAAWLFFGPWVGPTELSGRDAHFTGVPGGDYAGWAVAGPGDVDGDGWDDVVVGAPAIDELGAVSDEGACATEVLGWGDEDGESAGATYLLLGPVSGERSLAEADARITGEDGYDGAGRSMAHVGDLNGDGLADLFMGTYNCEGGDEAGAAYVVLGPVSGEVSLADADAKLIGEATGDRASAVLASAGDVDGDGSPDLLVAAPTKDHYTEASNGKVYLILNAISGDQDLGDADATFIGDSLGFAGDSLASAGDVDIDGYDDFLVGAGNSSVGARYAGSAFLVRGPVTGAIDLADVDPIFGGAEANDGVGCAVSGLGDTDADGLPDILIGGSGDDDGGADAGAAWLLGGASL